MAELNYKASNIAKVERKYNLNFFELVSSLNPASTRISDLLQILEGGGLSEDEAGDYLDTNGIAESIQFAVVALADSGFLAKSPEVQAAKEALKKDASQTTGETKKA